MTKTRIYIIKPKNQGPVDELAAVGDDSSLLRTRLVRAATPAQALRHVAVEFSIDVASQDDLVNAVAIGVKVEDAKVTP